MSIQVRYFQDFKTRVVTTPGDTVELERIQLKRWVVAGPLGLCEYKYSEEDAARAADEWQAFYEKYPELTKQEHTL